MRTAFTRYFAGLWLLVALASYACPQRALASEPGAAPTPAHPAVVRVGLLLRNLVAIDEVKENWQATGLLIAKWTDKGLGFHAAAKGPTYRDLSSRVWKPDFEFTNEEQPTKFRFVDFYVEPNGTVVYTQAFSATLSSELDLRRFPFDSEVLPLVVQASGDDLDRTRLQPDLNESGMSNRGYFGLAQWKAVSLTESLGTVEGTANREQDVHFGLKVQRNPRSYILKFIVPLLLLVMVSWVTFWLSHEEFKTKDQLGSAVSTLLIIVAFNVTASYLLPKTEYVTFIDALLFTCFVFVIISIATVVATHLIQMKFSDKLALRVRRLAGFVLPVAFLIAQAALLLVFHVLG